MKKRLNTFPLIIVILFSLIVLIHPASTVEADLEIAVYCDEACTNPCTHIEWGYIYPKCWSRQTVYVKNEGNVHSTSVWIEIGNWIPSNASQYIDFYYTFKTNSVHELPEFDTFTPGSPIVGVGEAKELKLLLWIRPNAPNSTFSFDIIFCYKMGADVTGDDVVDVEDSLAVGAKQGFSYTPFIKEDINRDGAVDIEDMSYVNRLWATCLNWYETPEKIKEDVAGTDHRVDVQDMVAIGLKWGWWGNAKYYKEDINFDGVVDIEDLQLVGADWMKWAPPEEK